MKRKKELIRKILLAIEAHDAPWGWVDLKVDGYTPLQISYHVRLLHEAGYIEADDVSSSGIYEWRAQRLTYEGHEILDTIRTNKIWRDAKKVARAAGVTSVKALFEVAKALAAQELKQHLLLL